MKEMDCSDVSYGKNHVLHANNGIV